MKPGTNTRQKRQKGHKRDEKGETGGSREKGEKRG